MERNRCLTDHQDVLIVLLLLSCGSVALEFEQRLVGVNEHSGPPGLRTRCSMVSTKPSRSDRTVGFCPVGTKTKLTRVIGLRGCVEETSFQLLSEI